MYLLLRTADPHKVGREKIDLTKGQTQFPNSSKGALPLRHPPSREVEESPISTHSAASNGSCGSLNINDPLPLTQILNPIQHGSHLEFMLSPISPHTTQLGRRLCVSEFCIRKEINARRLDMAGIVDGLPWFTWESANFE